MASGPSLDPFAAPPRGSRPDDDPFAEPTSRSFPATGGAQSRPAAGAGSMRSGWLVDRDPNGPRDATAEYTVAGAVSFADVLRRARRQGFFAGAIAGGAAGATFVLVSWLLVGTSSIATVAVRGEPRPPEEAEPAGVVVAAAPEAAATDAAAPEPPDPTPARRRRPLDAASAAAAPEHAGAEAPEAEEARAAGAAVAAEPPGASDITHIELTGKPDSAPPEPGAARGDPADGGGTAEPASEAVRRAPGEREVMAALREHADAIDECVALATGEEGDVRGRRFPLLVVIEPSGAVSGARVLDADVEAAPVGSCLVTLARQLSFPAFEGEAVQVELPVRYGRSE